MKIVDANVLLYAVDRKSLNHSAAKRWLVAALSGHEAVGLPWQCLLAFVRIGTNPRVFASPLTTAQAFDLVDSWTTRPAAVTVEPTTRHTALLRGLLAQTGSAGNLTMNAHLAALALEHGADVVTFDRDFARFDVRVHIPR